MTLRQMSNSTLPGLPKKGRPTGKLVLKKDEVKKDLTPDELKRLCGRDKYPINLDLSFPGFTLSNQDIFKKLAPNSVKELDISLNEFTELTCLVDQGKLKRLAADKNCLTNVSFAGLHSVVHISLGFNALREIPDMKDLANLQYLNLRANRLHGGYENLRALKSLRLLDLARNDIDLSLYEIYHQLIVPLKEIPKLQFLSLKSNPIEVKFPNFRYFVISELPRLEYYNYSKITKELKSKAAELETGGAFSAKLSKQAEQTSSRVTSSRVIKLTQRIEEDEKEGEKERLLQKLLAGDLDGDEIYEDDGELDEICKTDSAYELSALLDDLGFNEKEDKTSTSEQMSGLSGTDPLDDILDYLNEPTAIPAPSNQGVASTQPMGVASTQSITNHPEAMVDDEVDYFTLLGDMISTSTSDGNSFQPQLFEPSDNDILSMLDELTVTTPRSSINAGIITPNSPAKQPEQRKSVLVNLPGNNAPVVASAPVARLQQANRATDDDDAFDVLENLLLDEKISLTKANAAPIAQRHSVIKNDDELLEDLLREEQLFSQTQSPHKTSTDDAFDALENILLNETRSLSTTTTTTTVTHQTQSSSFQQSQYQQQQSAREMTEEESLLDMLSDIIEEDRQIPQLQSQPSFSRPEVKSVRLQQQAEFTHEPLISPISVSNLDDDELDSLLSLVDDDPMYGIGPSSNAPPSNSNSNSYAATNKANQQQQQQAALMAQQAQQERAKQQKIKEEEDRQRKLEEEISAQQILLKKQQILEAELLREQELESEKYRKERERSEQRLSTSNKRIEELELEEKRINEEIEKKKREAESERQNKLKQQQFEEMERIKKEREEQRRKLEEKRQAEQMDLERKVKEELELKAREQEAAERLAAARLRQLEEEERRIEEELRQRQEMEETRRRVEEEERQKYEEQKRKIQEDRKRKEEEERRLKEEEEKKRQEFQQKQRELEEKERQLKEKIEQKRVELLKQQQEEEDRKRKESELLLKMLEEEQEKEEKLRAEKEMIEKRQMEEKGLVDQLINQLDIDDIDEMDDLSQIDDKSLADLRRITFPYAIKNEEVQIFEQLGGGTFGSCYRSIYNKKEVVLKKLNCNLLQDEIFVNQFKEEITQLATLKSPFLFEVLGASTELEFTLVTEYVQGTPLFGMLRNRGIVLDIRDKLKYAQQIAEGLFYLHSENIIFQGLKSKNVIVTPDQNVKLRDFGLLTIKEFVRKQGAMGTPQYTAPEILAGQSYDLAADMYSLAILLWEIFSEQSPYPNMMAKEVTVAVLQDQLRPPEPPDCPIVIWKIINSCWNADPAVRPTIDTVVRILSQPLETLMKYGLTSGSSMPIPRGCALDTKKSAPAGASAGDAALSPSPPTASSEDQRLHSVIKQITDMIMSGHNESQIKALRVLVNIGRTETNIKPLINGGVIQLLHRLLKHSDPKVIENAANAISILTEWPECEEVARESGVILDAINNLSHTGDMVVLNSAKILISMTREPASQKAACACGISRVLVEMLQSPNDHFKMQSVWILSQLLEDESFQSDFHQLGGIKLLLMLLGSPNPGIQFRVLVALGNLLVNPAFYPVIDKAGVLKRLLDLLNSKNNLLKLQAVKATERFSKKGGLRAEITKNGGMQSLVQLLKADNDQELILIALSCLINFATDKQQILNFKRAEGLPAVLNLLGHPNHPVQYQALRFFESFIAPAELNKEIVRALGFVPRCIGLITSSHPGIQKTAIKMLIDLSSSQKALEAVVSGGGTPPLLSLLDHHDEDVRQQVSSLLTLLIAVDETVTKAIIATGSVPKLITMLRATQLQTKESAAILLCTLASDERVKQFLGSLNALPSLVSILRVTSDILAQEKIVSVFSQYLTDDAFHPVFDKLGGFEAVVLMLTSQSSIAQTGAIKCMLLLCRNPVNKYSLTQIKAHDSLSALSESSTPSLKMAALKCLSFLKS